MASKKNKEINHNNLVTIKPITDNQKLVFNSWKKEQHQFLFGAAGTGKTFISMYLALQSVMDLKSKHDKLVIVDECQNLNFHELDTIITRIGQDSRIIFCGDFDQTDLQRTNEINGLFNFVKILEEMEEFNCTEFTIGDIVRSGFIRSYLINKIKLGIGMD